ncbi:glycosyltransferase [bacterium]|nr:glycosyltransferase [bacterium]
MKILLDARYLDGSFTGIGTYSLQLIRHLVMLDETNEYTVIARPGFKPDAEWGERVKWLVWKPRPVSLSTLYRLGSAIDDLKVDLVHSLFPLAPLHMKTPLLITIHDLQPFIDPDFSARRPFAVQTAYNLFYRRAYPAVMRKARYVLNVSYYTGDCVAELFPEFQPKIIVVQSGLDPAHLAPPPDDFELVSAEFHLTNPYALYYGSTRPNKNLAMMIRAFAHHVRVTRDEETELVLILKRDRFFRDLPRLIRQEGMQQRVRVLDQVSPSEQRTLLANARAFLFPSKYEGFGFPALEAMAAHVPVVAGRSGALEEICGNDAEFVDVDNVEDIARGIGAVLRDTPHRNHLIERGRVRAERFSWKETAARVIDVYKLLF